MSQRLYLIIKEIISNRFITVIVFLSVGLSVFAVGLFGIIGNNLNNYVQNRFASSIPPNTIKVSKKPPKSFFLFQIKDPKSIVLNDRVLRKIKGMGGIRGIYPVMSVKIPMQARVSFIGFRYRTDIPCMGAPYRLVQKDIVGKIYRNSWKKSDKGIPVIIPKSILQAYNDGMAGQNNLPRLSEKGAIGIGFKLRFGHSSLKSLDGYDELDAFIAGFTDKINSLAVIIPLRLVRIYNKKFNKNYRTEYLYAFVKVKDHRSLITVSSQIKKLGFIAEAERSLSKQIVRLKRNINLIIGSLKYVIILLSIIAVSFATIIATLNRIDYYRIMRIIGSSKMFITLTILVKYILIGYTGAYAGLKLIEFISGEVAEFLNLSGLMISLSISEKTHRTVVLYGTLIPVLSTIPALIRLYFKALNRD